MNTYPFVTCILLMISILTACDGDGWTSENSDDEDINCDNASTTTNRYLSTSYDSCAASDADLTGLWIIVSEYSILKSGFETNKTQRMTMTITENSGGTLTAAICGPFELRNEIFNAGDSALSIYDYEAGVTIDLAISSNLVMSGEYKTDAQTTVQSSTVSAIKIEDTSSTAPGDLDLDYTLNGFSYSEESLDVSCFIQSDGTSAVSSSVTSEGESLWFYTNVDNDGTADELSVDIFIPDDANENVEITLEFSDSDVEIEGKTDDNASASYQTNSYTTIIMDATVTDDNTAANTASFSLDFDL